MDYNPQEKTITELQAAMEAGQVTSQELTHYYLARIETIDRAGPHLRSVIEVNPDALDIAAALDAERAARGLRGPLHGIPILLKDNIDTGDKMLTTAGSLAMVTSRPAQDATVVQQLRQAGAIILGKTNLSEWANFRGNNSVSGWSARGGQTRNPYALDHNPCGSSSGSAVAVCANLAAATLGTETDGSIVCPAAVDGVVGLKPTVGLTSRAGVIPVAHSQDTVGPITRTVADAAVMLGALTGVDPRDPATQDSAGKYYNDYTQFLDLNGLRGARIGIPREVYFGYDSRADAIIETAIEAVRHAGAVIIDPADIPTAQTLKNGRNEREVLLYEFKVDLEQYLAGRVAHPNYAGQPIPRNLADLIAFNEANADLEMPTFKQEKFEAAQAKGPLTEPTYLEALAANHRLSQEQGIDAVMSQYRLDALVAPTTSPAWPTDYVSGNIVHGSSSSPAAVAGYPLITVPAGYVSGLPVGLTFMGQAYSEPTLIKLAYAFEQLIQARRLPQFHPTLPE